MKSMIGMSEAIEDQHSEPNEYNRQDSTGVCWGTCIVG